MRLNQQTVGNVGLYYTCYRLSLLGWNVMPTSRNARGVDVVAYGPDGGRTVTVQVKALSKRSAVGLGKSLDHLIADFVIVCRGVQTAKPECFVLPVDVVKRLAHHNGAGDKARYWLAPGRYEAADFRENWAPFTLTSLAE